MTYRGGRSQVGDTEMGESKLRGDTSSSSDKAKRPDLSSSTHFPPLPGLTPARVFIRLFILAQAPYCISLLT